MALRLSHHRIQVGSRHKCPMSGRVDDEIHPLTEEMRRELGRD
jgi:hypothetical protein